MPAKSSVAALELKKKGNAFFSKRLFRQAASCYREAIGVLLQDDRDTDILVGILLSNESSCHYESGEYAKAAEDANACIELLDKEISEDCLQKGPLLCKNLWRLARALHYYNDVKVDILGTTKVVKDEITSVLQRLEDISDQTFSPNASKMLEQLSYYEHAPKKASSNFQPTPLRARLQDPYVEYFHFGHDVSKSLLRHDDIESQSIHLKDLGEDELSLSLLFGGVGDARHVMASLLDAHHQYLTLPTSRQEKFRLHMTLNDINAQLLAKDILVLVLSYEIGRLAKDSKSAFYEREPCILAMLIMYATMGYAMPKVVHEKMIECIQMWFTESSRETFMVAFPWLPLSQYTWDRIIVSMTAWLNPDESYTPNLPSVRESLDHMQPVVNSRSKEHLDSTVEMMDAGSECKSNLQNHVKDAMAERRRYLEEMEIPPEMRGIIEECKGPDVSEDEARECFITLMEKFDDEQMFDEAFTLTSPMDKLFFELTHALLPPQTSQVDGLKLALPLSKLRRNMSKDSATEVIMNSERFIHEEWIVNPVQTDPYFYEFHNGHVAPDKTNPIMNFPGHYLNETVKSYMLEPPIDICDEEPDAMKDPDIVPSNDGFARNVTLYYWNVGKALNDLCGRVTLEIVLGNIVQLGSQDRVRNNLPTKYNRISLSNIPDYTGMLSVFVTIAPLLASNTHTVTASLRSNTLLNTGMWTSYDDYLFSTVSLTYKEAEGIFSLSVADEEPNVWNSFVTWGRTRTTTKDEVSEIPIEKLRTWLHTLYLSIILPPDRDPSTATREERASSVGLFMMTLNLCTKELGIPAHQVFSILDDLLGKTSLSTKATLSNDSPTPALRLQDNSSTKTKYNLSAFHSELANQTAIFMQSNMLCANILSTKALPTASASHYELKLGGIYPKYSPRWEFTVGARCGSFALGFLLRKQKSSCYDISTAASEGNNNPMADMMMSMMGGGPDAMSSMMKKKSKLRQALLDRGSAIGHVFSSLKWNMETQTVSFWMCDDLFDKFKRYDFSLIRTDGWFQIPHEDVCLGDATRSISYC